MEQMLYLDYEYENAIKKFLTDMIEIDQSVAVNGAPGYCQDKNIHDWIAKEKENHLGIHLKDGFVPATTYLYILDDQVIGIINIRHCLNDFLKRCGGHIGYSVHPNYRRQGYATKMLKEALKKCQQWDITPVLVTCNKENIASQKTIEKCGGILEDECFNENRITLRYWIKGE